jgi:AcrR family transcriptional regulator
MDSLHPTKRALVQTVLDQLKTKKPSDLTSELILETSGISKGSLYHHFEDFDDLIETAQVFRYAAYVDQSIHILTKVFQTAKNRDEMLVELKQVTKFTQSPDLMSQRMDRATSISLANANPRMMKKLNVQQDRLNEALIDIFREARDRGWISKEVDLHAGAVFIQAYTLGIIINDVSGKKLDSKAWTDLIDLFTSKIIAAN